jgi:5-methylcytosine-specific restriction endonuclease McrA
MNKKYYANRRGTTYYNEKNIIEKISEKNLPDYIRDLTKRTIDALKEDSENGQRMLINFHIVDIDRQIRQRRSGLNNFFGLFPKSTPEIDVLQQEKWKLQKELEKHKVNNLQYNKQTFVDLNAACNLAKKRLDKINDKKMKEEALKQKTAIISEYQGKSRKVARSVKSRLPINPICPYCEQRVGNKPHADHIYPVSKGGRSTIANMVYICSTCNTNKRDMTLREFISKFNLNRDMIEKNLESLGKSF